MQNFKATVPLNRDIFEQTDGTAICWLGSAGFLLNICGTILLIDPVLSPSASDPMVCADTGLPLKRPFPVFADEVPRADYLLYSHADRDHLGPETVKRLSRLRPKIYSTLIACQRMTRYGINPDRIEFCRAGDVLSLNGNLSVEVIKADHPWQLKDMDRFGRPYTGDDCVGFIVNTPAGRLLFPGDSRLIPEHGQLGTIAFIALDVSNDPYHMGKAGSIWLANHYRDAKLVPCHFDTYDVDEPGYNGDLEGLFEGIVEGEERILCLTPGEILTI